MKKNIKGDGGWGTNYSERLANEGKNIYPNYWEGREVEMPEYMRSNPSPEGKKPGNLDEESGDVDKMIEQQEKATGATILSINEKNAVKKQIIEQEARTQLAAITSELDNEKIRVPGFASISEILLFAEQNFKSTDLKTQQIMGMIQRHAPRIRAALIKNRTSLNNFINQCRGRYQNQNLVQSVYAENTAIQLKFMVDQDIRLTDRVANMKLDIFGRSEKQVAVQRVHEDITNARHKLEDAEDTLKKFKMKDNKNVAKQLKQSINNLAHLEEELAGSE